MILPDASKTITVPLDGAAPARVSRPDNPPGAASLKSMPVTAAPVATITGVPVRMSLPHPSLPHCGAGIPS
jgi:hypothetical protein